MKKFRWQRISSLIAASDQRSGVRNGILDDISQNWSTLAACHRITTFQAQIMVLE